MIRRLVSKDRSNFLHYCSENFSKEFYILNGKNRQFLNDLKFAETVFGRCLKHGDFCVIQEDEKSLLGIAMLVTENDGKHLKVIANNPRSVDNLVTYIQQQIDTEFFVRTTKKNWIFTLVCSKYKYNNYKKFGFQFVRTEGPDIIYKYVPNLSKPRPYMYKEED